MGETAEGDEEGEEQEQEVGLWQELPAEDGVGAAAGEDPEGDEGDDEWDSEDCG